MAATAPLISICVPTYNGAAYLDACLASIVTQSHRDFEVLVVDDCSIDDTVSLARSWQERDARISVERNVSNLGLVGNWNRCIALAHGTWIKFLFQDDLMTPDSLERMLAVGESSGGFVASARTLLFDDASDPGVRDWYVGHAAVLQKIHRTGRMSPEDYAAAKLEHLDLNIVGEPSVTLIRRDLFERFGRFDPLLVQICDGEMWNRLALNVGLAYVSDGLVTFRVHGGSASAKFRENPFRGGALDAIIELSRLCDAPGLERFREVAQRTSGLQRVRDEVERRINDAFDAVRLAERNDAEPGEMRKMLSLVLEQLSGYGPARRRHALHRVKRLLGRI